MITPSDHGAIGGDAAAGFGRVVFCAGRVSAIWLSASGGGRAEGDELCTFENDAVTVIRISDGTVVGSHSFEAEIF